jgi:uncharacterized protein YkwD
MQALRRRTLFLFFLLAAAGVADPGTRFPVCEPSVGECLAAARAMELATEFVASGKLDEAEKHALAASVLAPTLTAPRVLVGIIREQQGRATEAADAYREALAWNPDESRALAALERLKAPRFADAAGEREFQLLQLTNEARRSEGLRPLKPHPVLALVAREHSAAMRDLGFFGHESTKPGCKTAFDRFLKHFDRLPRELGENVCRRWKRPESALTEANIALSHEELVGSPGHRRNILHPGFTYVGIGIAVNEYGDYWVTEMFMTPPASAAASAPPPGQAG